MIKLLDEQTRPFFAFKFLGWRKKVIPSDEREVTIWTRDLKRAFFHRPIRLHARVLREVFIHFPLRFLSIWALRREETIFNAT